MRTSFVGQYVKQAIEEMLNICDIDIHIITRQRMEYVEGRG